MLSLLQRCCQLPASFSRSFVAPLGQQPEPPTHVCPDPAPSADARGSSSRKDSSLQRACRGYPLRASTSHRPYLRFLISPPTPAALRCISWLIRVIAIKLLLLEVPSMVSGMRLGSHGLDSEPLTGTEVRCWGYLHSTKVPMSPEWLTGKFSP